MNIYEQNLKNAYWFVNSIEGIFLINIVDKYILDINGTLLSIKTYDIIESWDFSKRIK